MSLATADNSTADLAAEVKREHRATWWVYTGEITADGRERIRWQASMRGFWPGFDVTCSCGWESKTGGGVRRYVRELLEDHRSDAQWDKTHGTTLAATSRS